MKHTRKYYGKQIKKALTKCNRFKKLHKSKLCFTDNLDWDALDNRGHWTDVYLNIGKHSVFAFTASTCFADSEYKTGSAPESIRDIDSGLWNLYVNKEHITKEDVGALCLKWTLLQCPIDGAFLANVHYNDTFYGVAFLNEQYPRVNPLWMKEFNEIYRNIAPIKVKEYEPNI